MSTYLLKDVQVTLECTNQIYQLLILFISTQFPRNFYNVLCKRLISVFYTAFWDLFKIYKNKFMVLFLMHVFSQFCFIIWKLQKKKSQHYLFHTFIIIHWHTMTGKLSLLQGLLTIDESRWKIGERRENDSSYSKVLWKNQCMTQPLSLTPNFRSISEQKSINYETIWDFI